MEKTNSLKLEMGSDVVDIKHEPLEADMEYYVRINLRDLNVISDSIILLVL